MQYPYVSAAPYLDNRTGYPQNASLFTPPQMPMQQQEPGMICRPVTSIEEAKSIPTDFSGNLMIFPDLSHGMIHTKQLNYQDGSAIFRTYTLANPEPHPSPATPSPVSEFAPLSEVEALRQELDKLKSQFDSLAATQTTQEKSRSNTRGGTEK